MDCLHNDAFMEVKKTYNADLERYRPKLFLFSLMMALAFFVGALELSFSDRDDLMDSDFLDEIAEDMDFMPPVEQNVNMPEPEKETPTNSDQIEVVEDIKAPEEMNSETIIPERPELITETELEEMIDEKVESVTLEEMQNEVLREDEVDFFPEFPGGMPQLMRWLTQNLKYPEVAKQQKISGKVIVSFIVNTDGTISDVTLVKKADPLLDKETLRVMKIMPKWFPGSSNGKTCRTLVHMPVVFKL